MTILPAGSNRAVTADTVAVSLDTPGLGRRYALAVVPLGADGAATPDKAWLAPWNPALPFTGRARDDGFGIEIRLPALSPATARVVCLAYAIRAASTLRDLGTLIATVDGSRIEVAESELAASAVVFAELYRRGPGWKLRALQDGVFAGLQEFGRRMNVAVDDGAPGGPPAQVAGAAAREWDGSGFLVGRKLLVTSAHVVAGASSIAVTGQDGSATGRPMLVDARNGLALIGLDQDIGGEPLAFRTGGPALGDAVDAVGYPLAGLPGSGPQVAQGTVSGLLGPGHDARLLQITTPIPPGSSGGPLLDGRGQVIGVLTASPPSGPAMNFAVRSTLAEVLVEAAGRELARGIAGVALDPAAIQRLAQGSVWRLECRR